MSRSQREKGKAGEREVAALVREAWGLDARRGQQFRGTADSADVLVAVPGVYCEVKRREAGNVHRWLAEAADEADGQVALVFHRPSRRRWAVTLYAEDVPRLVAALGGGS